MREISYGKNLYKVLWKDAKYQAVAKSLLEDKFLIKFSERQA